MYSRNSISKVIRKEIREQLYTISDNCDIYLEDINTDLIADRVLEYLQQSENTAEIDPNQLSFNLED